MKSFLLLLTVLFSFSFAANAQSGKAVTKGGNANPDAPVNISEPGLRPSEPASYSATPLPDGQKGQFYVKDDKPAYSDYTPVQPPSPELLEKRKKIQAQKDADMKAASERASTQAKSAAGSKPVSKKKAQQ